MRILHYALGFPPYRSGGLTKFCIDLMVQQAKEGHDVGMLWPGQMGFFNSKVSIKNHQNENLKGYRVQSFEVINPLPVPFDEGIADIEAFIKDVDIKVYQTFLEKNKPDIIHVHTLMGLHRNFLNVARAKRIRLVFTAHDFFPICPKVTMFRCGNICDSIETCEKCGTCNTMALGLNKIKILQSPVYRELKDSALVKILRKKHRNAYLSESTLDESAESIATSEDYKRLREYYYSLLNLMDMVHYNSTVTKTAYESIFDIPRSSTISITHSDIKDNRVERDFINGKLRIRYLGPMGVAKGFFLLKAALDKLWVVRQDFCLDVHFESNAMSPYIRTHERYSYKDLGNIFDETDVLVAPSIWYETFGFTVLEALSYGVPVIVSGTVGAKDILAKGAGIVIDDITADKLYECLASLTVDKLKGMNRMVVENQQIIELSDMSARIEKTCYGMEMQE